MQSIYILRIFVKWYILGLIQMLKIWNDIYENYYIIEDDEI